MKLFIPVFFLVLYNMGMGQAFDTSRFTITVDAAGEDGTFFSNDLLWRGGDGASSIDLGNGKVLWLFSDSFICRDSSGSRRRSKMVRNSIAVQNGYDLKTASLRFYWGGSRNNPQAFFKSAGNFWFWTGHGVTIKDKLIIFLLKERSVKKGLGFEAFGWCVVLISNPNDDPREWQMKYIDGPDAYGYIAGSGAVVKDDNYLYAYGAAEPDTHEVYLLRWKIDDAYLGNIATPEWWIAGQWLPRKATSPVPDLLFVGQTEYSVHYDAFLKKFIQVQSFGFGEAKIGIRLSDSLQGPWTAPYLFYTPEYPGVRKPFMYSAKAHPHLKGGGTYVTYIVNSFDFGEVIKNETIYFPRFLVMKITEKQGH